MDGETAGVVQFNPSDAASVATYPASPLELARYGGALFREKPAVQQYDAPVPIASTRSRNRVRRVAVLPERRWRGSGASTGDGGAGSLALGGRCGLGGVETLLENGSFGSRIVEALSTEHAVGVLVSRRVIVFSPSPERQPGLRFGRRRGRHRGQAPDQ